MKKLFWEDQYLTECTAKVTEINGNKIKLDQSIFFAFSGGQESDEGTINGINVMEAAKKGDKEAIIDIEYTLADASSLKVGDEVIVKINSTKRDKLRRLHSAAHIMYYFVIEKLGKLEVIGSNITSSKGRMDFLTTEPVTPIIQELQDKTNKFIEEDHHVITKTDENKPDLRWWICEDWKMPCGGTHVKSTKEIGRVKFKRKNIGSGKERVEIILENEMQ